MLKNIINKIMLLTFVCSGLSGLLNVQVNAMQEKDVINLPNILSAIEKDNLDYIKKAYTEKPIFFNKEYPYKKDRTGLTITHIACSQNAIEIIRFLYEKNANLFTLEDANGHTPLFYACINNNIDIIRFFNKENQKQLFFKQDKNGQNILHEALIKGHKSIIDFFYNQETLRELFNKPDKNGLTPITYACKKDQLEVIQYLCNNYPKLFLNKSDKEISLMLNGSGKKVKTFLQYYDKQLKIYKEKNDLEYLILLLDEEKWLEITKFITAKNSSVCINLLNLKEENGHTPLITLCFHDQEALINAILDKISNENDKKLIVNAINNYNQTPLFHACNNKNWSLVKTLLKYCTTETIETFAKYCENNVESSCLVKACLCNNTPIKIIKKLATPKTINHKNKNSVVPLFVACKSNNFDAVTILLERNASLEIPNLFNLSSDPVICFFLNQALELDLSKNKIDFLKKLKLTNNKKLEKILIKRTIYKSLTDIINNDKPIHETDLAKIFNNQDINIQKILGTNAKDIYSFIEIINEEMQLDIEKFNEMECSICPKKIKLFKNKTGNITTICNHTFHKNCLLKWLKESKTSCPLCRVDTILTSTNDHGNKIKESNLDKSKQENFKEKYMIIDEIFRKKLWPQAKEILLVMPKGSIDLTKSSDMMCLNYALEDNQTEIIDLLLEKNEEITRESSNDLTNKNQVIIKEQKKPNPIQDQVQEKNSTNKEKPKKYYIIKIKNSLSSNRTQKNITEARIFNETNKTNVGWIEPEDENAIIAMNLARQEPETGYRLNTKMSDGKFKESNGWKKVIKIFKEINGKHLIEPIEIHYDLKAIPATNDQGINIYEADRFKFKQYSYDNDLRISNGTFTRKEFKGEKL